MNNTKWIARTAMLLGLTLVIQMLGMPKQITGPTINMMLIIATILMGWLSGAVIGVLTPGIALLRGILPPPLAPVIPFIIIGNCLLVVTYYLLAKKNNYIAIIAASLVKFVVLSSAVKFFVPVKPPIAAAMQLPQLLTALAGGFLALLLAKYIIKVEPK